MTDSERIIQTCNAQATLFEANALLFTGVKRAKRDGAAKGYRLIAGHFATLDIGNLREELLKLADIQCKSAYDCRAAFPEMSAAFEGHAIAYRDVAGLCKRLMEASDDDHAYDAQREEASLRREIRDYRADAERGMLP